MVGFPLLLIPLAIYNIVAWLMPDVPLTDPMFRLTLVSGAQWTITLSDILLTVGLLLLLLEIFKGARPGSKYLTDHLLSFVVFGAAAAEFVMLPKFGTSTFFLLSLMAMVDFFGGIALRARRGMTTPAVSRKVPARVEAAKPESPVEPVRETPAMAGAGHSAASAASVAESVLLDQSKPDQSKPDQSKPDQSKPDQSKTDQSKPDQSKPDQSKPDQSKPAAAQTAGEASPTVRSPELQPGSDSAPEAPQR